MSKEERAEVLQQLGSAAHLLAGAVPLRLADQYKPVIGYAVKGARVKDDIAAIESRLGNGNPVEFNAETAFGADERLARIILTVMRFNPAIRSAAVFPYDAAMIRVCETLFFEICHFDPEKEPPGIRTMEWGVAGCCREGIPDVIYNEGSERKEAAIRFLGENPLVVANNIIKVSARMS